MIQLYCVLFLYGLFHPINTMHEQEEESDQENSIFINRLGREMECYLINNKYQELKTFLEKKEIALLIRDCDIILPFALEKCHNPKIIKLLIDKGVDLSYEDDQKTTIFHMLTQRKEMCSEELIFALVCRCAPYVKNNFAETLTSIKKMCAITSYRNKKNFRAYDYLMYKSEKSIDHRLKDYLIKKDASFLAAFERCRNLRNNFKQRNSNKKSAYLLLKPTLWETIKLLLVKTREKLLQKGKCSNNFIDAWEDPLSGVYCKENSPIMSLLKRIKAYRTYHQYKRFDIHPDYDDLILDFGKIDRSALSVNLTITLPSIEDSQEEESSDETN